MDWEQVHQRYIFQCAWTDSLRQEVFSSLPNNARACEIGCGSGAVLASSAEISRCASLTGVDINHATLAFAKSQMGVHGPLIQADGEHLPFVANLFDLSFCHFLLLWCQNPIAVLREMVRITQRGGLVVAFAEPDYSNRIAAPHNIADLCIKQNLYLQNQGADTACGQKLHSFFQQLDVSILGSGAYEMHPLKNIESELNQLKVDLKCEIPEVDTQTILFHVPTYFACAMKN